MQTCTTKELANADCNFFQPLTAPPRHLTSTAGLPAVPPPRDTAVVMQLQSGVSLGEGKLGELHRERARGLL